MFLIATLAVSCGADCRVTMSDEQFHLCSKRFYSWTGEIQASILCMLYHACYHIGPLAYVYCMYVHMLWVEAVLADLTHVA